MHFGPDDVLATVSLDFDDRNSAGDVEKAISEIEREIKNSFPEISRVFIEAQSWQSHFASERQGIANRNQQRK